MVIQGILSDAEIQKIRDFPEFSEIGEVSKSNQNNPVTKENDGKESLYDELER